MIQLFMQRPDLADPPSLLLPTLAVFLVFFAVMLLVRR